MEGALHRLSHNPSVPEDELHSSDGETELDNFDAAREEEQRYQRYLHASQLHSGELQGMYATDLPPVSEASNRPSKNGGEEASSTDYAASPHLQHLGSFNTWGNGGAPSPRQYDGGDTSAPLPNIREEPSGVEDSGPEPDQAPLGPLPPGQWSDVTFNPLSTAGSGAVPNGTQPEQLATQKPTPFQQPTTLPAGLFNSQGGPGSRTTSMDQQGAGVRSPYRGSAPGTGMAAKPSERLGHSLGQQDRERITAQPSAEPMSRRGSIETGVRSDLLGDLPPEQQMVLAFTRISSWVQLGNLGAGQQKSLKEKLKPKNLALAAFKPVKDTARSAVKAGTAAGGAVQRITSGLTRRRHADSANDVETGMAGKPGGPTSAPKEGHRQILHAISGHVRPGHVLALMGPSGSGKTSLLSIVGGRAPGSVKLEGSVTVNGAKLNKANRRRIGFVLQDDVLYETLTVHETLTYAGLLRLPRTMTREEKMARVDAVIQVLGLTKSKDTIIGGYFRRGVSGGERKRVSVGHELLINPAVLLLDEPTSGLDSTTALHVVKLLRDLAAGGRAILTTIHQPSSRLYRKLDQVMLLAEGHVMYYGDALHAVDWFDHLGFGLPYGTNLADHILDCAMGEVVFDPMAPGAMNMQGSVKPGRTASAGGGDRERSMHGGNAVRSLYTTFEQWYANHPDGFTLEQHNGPTTTGHGGLGRLSPRAVSRASSSALVHGMLEDVHLVHGGRKSLMGTPAETAAASAAGTTAGTAAAGRPSTGGDSSGTGSPVDSTVVVRVVGDHATVVSGPQTTTATTAGGTAGNSTLVQRVGGTVVKEPPSPADSHGDIEAKRHAQDTFRSGASFWRQIAVLWTRALKVRRFESLSGQQLFQLVGVAVITGLLWWQRGNNDDVAGAQDILGLLFFEMLFVSFRTLFSALFTFPNEFRMLSKERPSGMYKLSAYYISRTLADLPIEVLYPTLYVIIVYWFGGLRATAAAFFGNWLSTLLIVLVAQVWGLLLGGLFMDPKMAQTVTTVLMLTFLLVGGFYVRDVPVWIGWIKYLSFVYWGNRLLIKIEYKGRDLTDCAAAAPGQPCPILSAGSEVENALRLPANPNDSVYPEVLVLIGMLVLLRWVTYMVLRWKTGSQAKTI